MSLNDVAKHRVFASVTAQAELVRHYVPSHELSGVGGADRLRNANIDATVDDLIHPQALAELQGVYFTASHNFRRVLECADEAARLAADDGADQIAPRHVQHVLEQR